MNLEQLIMDKKNFKKADTVRKVSKYAVFSGLYLPVFGLNTEIYFNLRI